MSHAGVASRRKAAEIIAAGRVTVDGVVVKEPGERVDPATAKISVDGKPLAADGDALQARRGLEFD